MQKIKTRIFFASLFLLFLFVFPVLGEGLVPCDGFDCTFDQLLGLPGTIIDFVLFQLIPPLAVLGFVYAGFIMMTSDGNSGKFNQGRNAMLAIAVGLIIVYLSWSLVKLFIEILGGQSWVLQFFKE